jgi:D-aminoacyl-tRNA deacylase
MKVVVQRVSEARVEVDGKLAGKIGAGLLVLLGVKKGDTPQDAEYLAEKLSGLRVFPDEDGRMNRDVLQAGGAALVVSQFTLYGDVRRGRRPSFDDAAGPDDARRLYEYFIQALGARGVPVQTGVFQAAMSVHLVNSGPVTIIIESRT